MFCSNRLESEVVRFSRIISLIGLFGLLLLSCITMGEVFLRSAFDYPILGVSDISQLLVVVVVASCFPLVSAEKRHIKIQVLGKLLGKRAYDWLEAFSALVSLVFFTLLTWQLWLYSSELAASSETTWIILLPTAPWWRAATCLMALCIPNQLVCLFTSIKSACSSEQ
jgi:TRAP-type C4-dicarboxylate transport system permease small subunit